jgi:hypothetical protein
VEQVEPSLQVVGTQFIHLTVTALLRLEVNMAHFAKLNENNIVIQVNVVDNSDIQNLPFPESEQVGIDFLTNWSGGYSNWKQTSYNRNFRKNYAGIGYTYDQIIDAFVPPKPYPSWLLDTDTAQWKPPVPMPNDGKNYQWDEENQTWVEVPNGN